MENQNNLTLGSLFDGSAGFPLGGLLSGITPLWASEIEPFPIRVTTKRLPQMKHYGDITAMDGAKLPPVDIITFGSPCQDMSVAGRRDGLGGSRSSLFFEAVRIVKEMRCATDGKYPRFIVWENVDGAFSSNHGEDFRAVLEEICRIKDEGMSVPGSAKWNSAGNIVGDDFSVAWRRLDAQFWGVPQRRKRIYLVADFAGQCAGKILFESEGLSGYSAQGFRAWQETACRTGDGLDETGGLVNLVLNDQGGERMDVTKDVTCTLRAESHHPPCVMAKDGDDSMVFENHGKDCRYKGPLDVAQTVLSIFGTGGNNQPFVLQTPKTLKIRSGCEGGGKGALIQDDKSATLGCNNDQTLFVPKAYGICSKESNSMKSDNPDAGFYEADTSRTLDANGGNPSCNQGGIAVVAIEGNGTRPSHRGAGYSEKDVMFTLNATEQHGVVYSTSKNSHHTEAEENLANTLVASDYKDPPIVGGHSYGFYPQMKAECVTFTEEKSGCLVNGTNPGFQNGVVDEDYIVRRLTPTECARLQGFPDWWCDDLGTSEPTDEDIAFWRDVFSTHAKALGKDIRPKTDSQIRKWLMDPHSDSAEYRMWGNGVALPNVVFVLSGIAYYAQKSE